MDDREYLTMARLEDTYWWHVGRRSILDEQLKRLGLSRAARILNVGCGTGGMIPLFRCHGEVVNVDVSQRAIDFVTQRGLGHVHKVDGVQLPFPDGHFDVVLATDVLEHIQDDGAALVEWNRVLRPGGHLIMTVPAYQWLWSEHDESLHHHRRYTATRLQRKLESARFRVTRRSYTIVFSFPLVVGYRLMRTILPRRAPAKVRSSYVMLPAPINRLFTNLLRIEARLVTRVSLPFGTSVLAVAQTGAAVELDLVGQPIDRTSVPASRQEERAPDDATAEPAYSFH